MKLVYLIISDDPDIEEGYFYTELLTVILAVLVLVVTVPHFSDDNLAWFADPCDWTRRLDHRLDKQL